jgi:hypothetical protein
MTTQPPSSNKFLEQAKTDQPQEASTSETSSVAPRFVAIRPIGSDGRAVIEKIFCQVNHDFVDIYLIQAKE